MKIINIGDVYESIVSKGSKIVVIGMSPVTVLMNKDGTLDLDNEYGQDANLQEAQYGFVENREVEIIDNKLKATKRK